MHERIHTAAAPEAVGPYSQAIKTTATTMIFCSGQVPLDPKTQELVTGDIETQARRVMDNLKAVLAEAGADFSHVVKTTILLVDLNDFATVNAVYGSYFGDPKPARATFEVSRLPKDARVEIEAIAVL